MIGRFKPTDCTRCVRVMIDGEYVLLTPSQARRYEELLQTGKYRRHAS